MIERDYSPGTSYPEHEPLTRVTRHETAQTSAYAPQNEPTHDVNRTARGRQTATRSPERRKPMTLEDLLTCGVAVLTSDPVTIPEPSERVRLRKAARLTATNAAVLCGATRRAVEQWERGEWEPTKHVTAYGRLLAYCERTTTTSHRDVNAQGRGLG